MQLTDDAAREHELHWLPDGSRLVFVSSPRNEHGLYFGQLASILPDGTGRQELGEVGTAYGGPIFSPDGRYIAFGGSGDPTAEVDIVVLDLALGVTSNLITDGGVMPIWSPDGRRILAVANNRHVVVVEVPSGKIVAKIEDRSVEEAIGWTPDGNAILFGSCGPATCNETWVTIANADGTEPRRYDGPVPTHSQFPGVPSPDGRWIAWTAERLHVATADRSRSAAITGPSFVAIDLPSWSRDGEWLAVTGQAQNGPSRIYLVPRAGGDAIPVTPGPWDSSPSWEP